MQGCPLNVIINLMTSVSKKILDAQSQAIRVSSARLPPGGKPGEALDCILTALGYADDTYGVAAGQHTVEPLLECTHEWLQTTGQDVNPKKLVNFIIPDSDQEIQMRGVSFPKETDFHSLGASVRTIDSVASGPLILKRRGKASALLDRIQGVQGDIDERCKVVATMVNAIGLHASEIVAISQKDIRPFETRILKAIWGASRPGRAKEIIFCLMCQGRRLARSMLVPYGRAVWLARLCKTRGPAMITAQTVREENPLTGKSGPFGRALKALHDRGWRPLSGWWEWKVPGATGALQLTGDFKLVKHNIREQLRSQQITQLIARRPRQFVGMRYHTNRRLVCASIASFKSQQQRSMPRTLLAGGLWTAARAHQRGMITSQCCPYCKQADETEKHILWDCAKWAAARDVHIANVRALAAKVPDLPPYDKWPPCYKISGLLPEIQPPVNRQVE